MYGEEKSLKSSVGAPVLKSQPALALITNELQNVVVQLGSVTQATKGRLCMIKSRDNQPMSREPEDDFCTDSATGELIRIIRQLNAVLADAEANLKHLEEIV